MAQQTQKTDIVITSNNVMAYLFTDLCGGEARVNEFMKKLQEPKSNLVFDNLAGVSFKNKDGKCITSMVKNTPSNPKRFISPVEFEAMIESLCPDIPSIEGLADGDEIFMFRHGPGYHNLDDAAQKDTLASEHKLRAILKKKAEFRLGHPIDEDSDELLSEMVLDAGLTPKGIVDTMYAVNIISSHIPDPSNRTIYFHAATLNRTYHSAALLARELKRCDYQVSDTIRAGFVELTERSRAIGSPFYNFGSSERLQVESLVHQLCSGKLKISLEELAFLILKKDERPKMSLEEFIGQPEEIKKPIIGKVTRVLRENTPVDVALRPKELLGFKITHDGSGKTPSSEVSLLKVLSDIASTKAVFVFDNKMKKSDAIAVFGNNIQILDAFKVDEIQDVPECVASTKGRTAFSMTGKATISEDTSFGPKNGSVPQLDSFCKFLWKKDKLPVIMKKIYGECEFFVYRSLVTLTSDDSQHIFKSEVVCIVKDCEGNGDIDPYCVPLKRTVQKKVNNSAWELISEETFENPEQLTIGQLQKKDPSNRKRYGPRQVNFEALKKDMNLMGIPY
jgi:hypothetical protein